jgi:hypothetical protein
VSTDVGSVISVKRERHKSVSFPRAKIGAKHHERMIAVRAGIIVERARTWRSVKFEEGSGFGRGE